MLGRNSKEAKRKTNPKRLNKTQKETRKKPGGVKEERERLNHLHFPRTPTRHNNENKLVLSETRVTGKKKRTVKEKKKREQRKKKTTIPTPVNGQKE